MDQERNWEQNDQYVGLELELLLLFEVSDEKSSQTGYEDDEFYSWQYNAVLVYADARDPVVQRGVTRQIVVFISVFQLIHDSFILINLKTSNN